MIKKIIVLCFSMSLFSLEQKVPIIFIEGNIGAGKSTFLQILTKYFSDKNVIITSEPCKEWQDIQAENNLHNETYNLLDAFYKNPIRWSYAFQLYAMMTRVKKQEQELQDDTTLQFMERSWFSDKYCFAQNAYDTKLMNDMEWAMYCNMWNYYAARKPNPAAFIYLQTTPDICYRRMKTRAREEENIIPLDYLQKLHERHENWLIKKEYTSFSDIPVLILNGMTNFKENEQEQEKLVQQILDFLKKHEIIDFTK